MTDETSEHVASVGDPTLLTISGVAVHGNTPFECEWMSKITDNLWMGGCTTGLVLPREIEYVVSLYPWEEYTLTHEISGRVSIRLFDAGLSDPGLVIATARMVNAFRKLGTTLVHCQAGLNRSGLIAALALAMDGHSAVEAVKLLRDKRSPAVLCNPEFEAFLLNNSWERFA